ncbi:Ger(x)C family spore germination protein [Bacillus sp. PS06]|uniref:Ger(x)C family spore germination protein n=1 Tax=Bacillus sp. PS06 TaxID=2764176 RepID=UPI00177C8876|nr:Ger(x)C family spore germination protein [Bacillus sp. PS06]MBD8067969.1 Ger(x)C family spore germination protein [Bacillus sp. PS06]
MDLNLKRFVMFITLICLTGCWDRIEINDLAFVTATGIDKEDENKFRVSCQIPLPGAMGGAGSSGGGGGTSGEKPYYVDSSLGRNVKESNDNLQQQMSRRLYFAHRRVVVFGKELASSGFKKSLDVILVQPQSRLSTFVVITEGKAIDILNASPHLEQLPAEAIREMTKNSLGINVRDVLLDISRPGKDPVIPIVDTVKTNNDKKEEQSDEIKIDRFAVLKNDKLVFSTNPEESLGIMWLKQKMTGKSITYPIGDTEEVNVEINRENLTVTHNISNGKPSFTINVKAYSVLKQNEQSFTIKNSEIYGELKEKLDKTIEDQIESIIEHSKSESIDVFGFGWYLFRYENKQWQDQWEKNWDQLLKDLEVTIKADTDIRTITNTGIDAED